MEISCRLLFSKCVISYMVSLVYCNACENSMIPEGNIEKMISVKSVNSPQSYKFTGLFLGVNIRKCFFLSRKKSMSGGVNQII